MRWLQLTLSAKESSSEWLEEILTHHGAVAVTLQNEQEDEAIYEPLPGETPLWNTIIITGLFEQETDPERLLRDLAEDLPEEILRSAHYRWLEDQVWERAWIPYFAPRCFGQRLWIYPSHTPPPEEHRNSCLLLDPGLAFGTGSHPTTALCLEVLAQWDLTGCTLIDYGTGSGILAIAAAKLGAKQIWAIDIDPQALEATRANAESNQVLDRILPLFPEQLPDLSVDIVVANILANPLIDLAPGLTSLLNLEGKLLLSGILQEQSPSVMEAYTPWIEWQTSVVDQSWMALIGHKSHH